MFEIHGLTPPHVTVETGPQVVRFPVIASSDLLGYTWTSLVRRAMPYLRLVELHIKELELRFGAAVAYRKDGHLSPAARRFIEILKTTAKEIASEKP